jgi:hypothetical protein
VVDDAARAYAWFEATNIAGACVFALATRWRHRVLQRRVASRLQRQLASTAA